MKLKQILSAVASLAILTFSGTAGASFYPYQQTNGTLTLPNFFTGGNINIPTGYGASLDPYNPGQIANIYKAAMVSQVLQNIFKPSGNGTGDVAVSGATNGQEVVLKQEGNAIYSDSHKTSDVWMHMPSGWDQSKGYVRWSLSVDPPHPIESSSEQPHKIRARIGIAQASNTRVIIKVGGKQVEANQYFVLDENPKFGVYQDLAMNQAVIDVYNSAGQRIGAASFFINYKVNKFASFGANAEGQNSETYQEIKPGTVSSALANSDAYLKNSNSKFGGYEVPLDGVEVTSVSDGKMTVKDADGKEMVVQTNKRTGDMFKVGDKVFISGKLEKAPDGSYFIDANSISAEKIKSAVSGTGVNGKPSEKDFKKGNADFLQGILDQGKADQDRLAKLKDNAQASLTAPMMGGGGVSGGGGGGGVRSPGANPNNPNQSVGDVINDLKNGNTDGITKKVSNLFGFNLNDYLATGASESGVRGAVMVLGVILGAAAVVIFSPAGLAAGLSALLIGGGLTLAWALVGLVTGNTEDLQSLGNFLLHPISNMTAFFEQDPITAGTMVITAAVLQKFGKFIPPLISQKMMSLVEAARGTFVPTAIRNAMLSIGNYTADISLGFSQRLAAKGLFESFIRNSALGAKLGEIAYSRAIAKDLFTNFAGKPQSEFMQNFQNLIPALRNNSIWDHASDIYADLIAKKIPNYASVNKVINYLKEAQPNAVNIISESGAELKAFTGRDKLSDAVNSILRNQKAPQDMVPIAKNVRVAMLQDDSYRILSNIESDVSYGMFKNGGKEVLVKPVPVFERPGITATQGVANGEVFKDIRDLLNSK
ncbi:hypothetical protein [Anaeromusa acidaminophila]|uniref:hypothetical protein n=1 Tax=Anaeromusa acidaminophila TaxID=81464 RepID=UPI0003765084|nr:hypothetical protein [Anaeromusa acidaminophila]